MRSKSGRDAVSLTSSLVMVDRQRLLKLLIAFFTPWINAEHTPAMYSQIFLLVERPYVGELNVDWAMAILYST